MYRLTRFGTLDLEHYNQVDTIGSGSTPTSYQLLPGGGALDRFGDRQMHPGAVERTKSLRLRVSAETSTQEYMALLSLRGRRDRLYRRLVDGSVQWIYARLVEVGAQRNFEQAKFRVIQDIDLRFVTEDAFWRGALRSIWYFDSGEYFDTGLYFDSSLIYPLTGNPTKFTVDLSSDIGMAPTRAIVLTISAGNAAMSNITIVRTGGESLTFSGTVAANKQLVIDTGTMQVLNDGADAYASLILAPTADLSAWFTLLPGDNPVTVSFSGGGTGKQIEFSLYEAWY